MELVADNPYALMWCEEDQTVLQAARQWLGSHTVSETRRILRSTVRDRRAAADCDLSFLWNEMHDKWVTCGPKSQRIQSLDSDFLEVASESNLKAEFYERAEKWERESGIHSAPGATYLYKDYLKIIAMGIANQKAIVPLILGRLQNSGSDWFFALENIADENPAIDAETFDAAFDAWWSWARKKGIIGDNNEALRP